MSLKWKKIICERVNCLDFKKNPKQCKNIYVRGEEDRKNIDEF
jgi:hypothetical protein